MEDKKWNGRPVNGSNIRTIRATDIISIDDVTGTATVNCERGSTYYVLTLHHSLPPAKPPTSSAEPATQKIRKERQKQTVGLLFLQSQIYSVLRRNEPTEEDDDATMPGCEALHGQISLLSSFALDRRRRRHRRCSFYFPFPLRVSSSSLNLLLCVGVWVYKHICAQEFSRRSTSQTNLIDRRTILFLPPN